MCTRKVMVMALVVVMVAPVVLADPLAGQFPKFSQVPMDGTLVDGVQYWGHDELSTAWLDPENQLPDPIYTGTYMADDFADELDTPVVHVRWWGSYMGLEGEEPTKFVDKFAIVFEDDVPATENEPSHPGNQLLRQVVYSGDLAPGSGTFTEKPISPGGLPLNEHLYEYNAELAIPFAQEPDTVYWLKIVALVDEPVDQPDRIQWGWHNRDYTVSNPLASPNVSPGEHVQATTPGGNEMWHFQDDAVTGSVANVWIDPEDRFYVHLDQDAWTPTTYLDDVDGPGPDAGTNWEGVGIYSKDLAFEVFTPEPATLGLMVVGGLALMRRRRSS